MALVTTKELLTWAKENKVAICAFNVNNMEITQAVAETANELNLPIILQVSKGARKYASPEYLTKLVEAVVATTNIPVALHLDHGDSFELCKSAIDSGFTSVMIDASHLPLEGNIALTNEVVAYAKARGVSVEAEIGRLSGVEDNISVSAEQSFYTSPEEAEHFAKQTNVDSLAVAIGTSHGAFKFSGEPKLRLDILQQIHERIPNVPLVLHGASSIPQHLVEGINKLGGKLQDAKGAPEQMLKETIAHGVCKINIDSDLRLAYTLGVKEYLHNNPTHFDPRGYLGYAKQKVKEIVKYTLQMFTKK